MNQVRSRLEQEILPLGANYLHLLSESVDGKHGGVSCPGLRHRCHSHRTAGPSYRESVGKSLRALLKTGKHGTRK
jgi:hypothetical protein